MLKLTFTNIQYRWAAQDNVPSTRPLPVLIEQLKAKMEGRDIIIVDDIMNREVQLICVLLQTEELSKSKKALLPFFESYHNYYFQQGHPPKPLLFISLMDVMHFTSGLYQDEVIPSVFRRLNLSPHFRFLDSSIWLHYLPILPIKNGGSDKGQAAKSFVQRFEDKLTCIRNFREQGLYDLIVTHEYFEFQLRLLQDSCIKAISNNSSGGHKQVTPFRFHSESKLADWANNIQKQLRTLNWRVWVIDDYSDRALKRLNASTDSSEELNKTDIIKKLVCHYYSAPDDESALIENVTFEKCDKLQPSIDRLLKYANQNNPYQSPPEQADIILLDYLFEDDEEPRKYGYYLLEEVKKELKELANARKQPMRYLGPLKKLHIMPISVYSNVFSDKMIDLGLSHNYWFWHLYSSADPISTPGLFRFNLFRVMKQQLEGLVRFDMREGPGEEIATSQLLYYTEKIVSENKISREQLTANAIDQFANIIELGARFKYLAKYKEASPFAASVIDNYFFGFTMNTWDHFEAIISLLRFFSRHRIEHILEKIELLLAFLEQPEEERTEEAAEEKEKRQWKRQLFKLKLEQIKRTVLKQRFE
ncbi:MAG: hypothetical protein AAGG75_18915 [Bacteroidota bacterium]